MDSDLALSFIEAELAFAVTHFIDDPRELGDDMEQVEDNLDRLARTFSSRNFLSIALTVFQSSPRCRETSWTVMTFESSKI